MAISLRLKELRQRAGATQTELARLLGVSREAYSMYEAGKRQPGLTVLDTVASYYRVTVDYLVGRIDCPDAEPLTAEERMLVQAYRALDVRGRKTVYGAAELQTLMLTKQLSE